MRGSCVAVVFAVLISADCFAISLDLGVAYVARDLNVLLPDSSVDYGTVDGNNAGTISDQYNLRPAVSIRFRERYFGSSRFGWYVEANFGSSELSRQADNGDAFGSDSNRGTKIDAQFVYTAPMLFYRFGPRFEEDDEEHWATTIGVGYGISYVSLSGDMILNGLPPYERITINEHQTAETYNYFIGTGYKKWYLRLSITDMAFRMSSSPKYDMSFFDSSIIFGRRFNF